VPSPVDNRMNHQTPTVSFAIELPEKEAWFLAQFFKRASFSDFRRCAQTDDEAYLMRNGAYRVRAALADAGFDPR
jgi:hypothetical protein